MAGESYLVVGLGNIGPEYSKTRHNMGFMVLDAWSQASNTAFNTMRYGDVAEIHLKGRTVYLLKPSTYMNLSGNAVRYYLQKLPIPTDRLLVICDDINLPFGKLRMRKNGSDGGHNGLKNIAECLETENYARIRMGVGHEFSTGAQADYVLGNLSEEEMKEMDNLSEKVIQGVKDWIFVGADRAMNVLNAKK
ncbi:MAG: aminoacyl-tRNA hydrolase [Bacteroidales bacterium]|nr:aminoacyl-tRNA hydrolase [Bacteroidales bacterium]MDD7608525.1 aminoacyl-tRNA hydrolase [Bacteroidales bacterium]MDY5459288.1 aminoacyl-tRNA hydrolase [Candidatus Cryptobacteroides sp.]MEE0340392.1 aminoacyl-tRNA hydrolase [Bacteroidales bacterium]